MSELGQIIVKFLPKNVSTEMQSKILKGDCPVCGGRVEVSSFSKEQFTHYRRTGMCNICQLSFFDLDEWKNTTIKEETQTEKR